MRKPSCMSTWESMEKRTSIFVSWIVCSGKHQMRWDLRKLEHCWKYRGIDGWIWRYLTRTLVRTLSIVSAVIVRWIQNTLLDIVVPRNIYLIKCYKCGLLRLGWQLVLSWRSLLLLSLWFWSSSSRAAAPRFLVAVWNAKGRSRDWALTRNPIPVWINEEKERAMEYLNHEYYYNTYYDNIFNIKTNHCCCCGGGGNADAGGCIPRMSL